MYKEVKLVEPELTKKQEEFKKMMKNNKTFVDFKKCTGRD